MAEIEHTALLIEKEISATPIERLAIEGLAQSLFIKREDQCHAIVSGNKWHKLRLNLLAAKASGFPEIVSFGGAWSNHIHALAYACMKEGLVLHAYIRGDELAHKPLNNTLSDVHDWGGQVHFLSRSDYRNKNNHSFLEHLHEQHPQAFLIPEGGANKLGVKGCEQFALNTLQAFKASQGDYPDYLALAAGTGTMTAGFLKAISRLSPETSLSSYLAVNDKARVFDMIASQAGEAADLSSKLRLEDAYCCGGFAKTTQELTHFCQAFEKQFNIKLDPVYTSKLFFGVLEDIKKHVYPKHATILLVHSGGLQGLRANKHGKPGTKSNDTETDTYSRSELNATMRA